jgi:PASTA domain
VFRTFRRCYLLIAVGLISTTLSLAVSACGDEGGDEAASPPQTVTVEETVEKTVPEEDPAEPSERPPKPSDDSEASGGGSIRVPNVVGKDHQLAQDTMQGAGLYNLMEEDATGQDRLLLIDRNWTVVSQDPPAGSRVSEDATITLKAKKDGE